jgi:VanZ family protein
MIKKNILSITVALAIMYLSLSNAKKFDDITTFKLADKLVHTAMYFGFMVFIIFENRKTLFSVKQVYIAGLIPLFYGILLEILQGTITETRTASFSDALFNAFGILIAILLWLWIKPFLQERIR